MNQNEIETEYVPSDEKIKELKAEIEKKTGKEISWEEASEGMRGLMQLAELALEHAIEEQKRKKKLEEFPKGFHLEGIGYSCAICGNHISNEETWYDKFGIKCLICQKAVDRKVIPGSAVRDKESWYSKWDLENRFNIDRHTLKKFVTAGILKPRNVLDGAGRTHAQIFLIKDNKDTLPQKKLTDSHSIKETKDGKDWFTVEPWYKFVDPHKHLKGYKIMDHLKVVHEEKKEKPIEQIKNKTMKINELFKVGNVLQSIDGKSAYLDRNNCTVYNKSKNEDSIILHLKRESDGEEGNAYLRVKDEFKELEDQLLNWAFTKDKLIGLTLDEVYAFETRINIGKVKNKLIMQTN